MRSTRSAPRRARLAFAVALLAACSPDRPTEPEAGAPPPTDGLAADGDLPGPGRR